MAFKPIPERPEYAGVLPTDFLHGYASAAYQVEGATQADGRGPCNWDRLLKDYPDNGNDACRSYELWKDDIALLKEYGARSYRFSVSWSRIIPEGRHGSPVNEAGVRYYNNLIDGLLEAGIEPTITLHHYDTPLTLEKRYRGFAAEDPAELIEDFVAFSRVCFERFGDRVKRWLTINEPYIFACHCAEGLIPNYTRREFFRVGHNSLLLHGQVVRLFRSDFQKVHGGQIGIALNNEWVVPLGGSDEAKRAAAMAEQRTLGWFALPIFKGTQTTGWDDYGDTFPRFTPEELTLLNGSADFFSINHYGTSYATGRILPPGSSRTFFDQDDVEKTFTKDGKAIGRRGENGHPYTVPWGFRQLLVHCWDTYAKERNLPIFIFENGYAVENEANMALHDLVDDKHRQEHLDVYISAMCDAVKDHGVWVQGYHCWSLLDNLEWSMGYGPRFGVTYIDRKNGFKRVPKDSHKTLADVWGHTIRR